MIETFHLRISISQPFPGLKFDLNLLIAEIK
jgi:hypothetical protein